MKYYKRLGFDKTVIAWYQVGNKKTVCINSSGISFYPAMWDFSDEEDVVPSTEREVKKTALKIMSKIIKNLGL